MNNILMIINSKNQTPNTVLETYLRDGISFSVSNNSTFFLFRNNHIIILHCPNSNTYTYIELHNALQIFER